MKHGEPFKESGENCSVVEVCSGRAEWARSGGRWEGFGSFETPMRIFSFRTRAGFVVPFLVAAF